jgi:hypothetical protein
MLLRMTPLILSQKSVRFSSTITTSYSKRVKKTLAITLKKILKTSQILHSGTRDIITTVDLMKEFKWTMKVRRVDYLGWWSVTPEELASYTAQLCKDKVVVDGFCGSGGNVIQVYMI